MDDKIFHQVTRYEYAKYVINTFRFKECHTILEVGAGAHGNLAAYLPGDNITFLDIDLPEEVLSDSRFVIGDATKLQYADNSFDFVIALDVIEHIGKADRTAFIQNINRVASQGVVLTAPHLSSQSQYEDRLLRTFYSFNHIAAPAWIDEHIHCTLPTCDEILQLIQAQGIKAENIITSYSVKRSLMTKMLVLEAITSKYMEFTDFFNVANSDYIHTIMPQDMCKNEADAVKTHIVWFKADSWAVSQSDSLAAFDEYSDLDKFEEKYSSLTTWLLELENIGKTIEYRKALQADIEQVNINMHQYVGNLLDKSSEQNNRIVDNISAIGTALQNLEAYFQNAHSADHAILRKLESCTAVIDDRLQKIITQQKKIKLNVLLVCYNQEKFIEDTLKSILEQETNFCFNIVVADDCSTDGTISIIKSLEKQTDVPFIYLPNSRNLGIMPNYKRAFAACNAEYIAIMEGDDLWTDKRRLQKHVEFLEAHTECVMSFNRFVVKNFEEGTAVTQPRYAASEEMQYFKYISGHDLAYSNLIGNFSTSVYRASALKMLPEGMYDIKGYDWLTNLMVSRMGYIGCLIQPMSIYRIHSNGMWSGQSEKERLLSIIELIDVYNEYTKREFSDGFAAHRARLLSQLAALEMPVTVEEDTKQHIKSRMKKLYRFSTYLPPVFIQVIKLFIPKALQEKIVRHL